MTAEQFRAILAAAGGLMGTEIVDKSKEEEIAGVKTGELVPPTTIRVRYTTPNGEIVARQKDDGSFEILDDPKGLVRAGGTAGGDKPIEVGGKLVQKQPDGTYKTIWPPADAATAGEKPVEVGGQIVQRQPDGSYKTLWEPPTKPPSISVPAARPGQRTDLNAVKAASDIFLAGLAADKTLTEPQRNQRWQQYYETTVRPAFEQATREVNEAADRLTKKQEEQTSYERLTEREKEETRQREARLGFGYKAGRDAVSDAMAMLPYETGPSFGPELAGIYNQILGAGTFSPGAFTMPRPDTHALATSAVDRAMALYDTSVPQRSGALAGAGAGMPGAVGAPTGSPALPQPSAAGTAAAMASVPFTPRPGVAPSAPAQPVPTPTPLPPGWEDLYPRPANY